MNIKDLEKLQDEGTDKVPSRERRTFLKVGLAVTGLFLGGTVLSLTKTKNARGAIGGMQAKAVGFPYHPHYSMVIRQNRCIDCERCKVACAKTNDVPSYGYRTTILEIKRVISPKESERIFMPVLCNQCNRPPCVRVCPTKASYKDKKNGIIRIHYYKCIGCKTCMAACPYNARYYNEERRSVDKCNFCYDTRLTKGKKDTACVAICPAKVRIFGDLSDPGSRVYKLIHIPDKVVWVLRPATGTLPNVFYMND